MTDAFKEISKCVVEKGPLIGHFCVEKRKVSLQVNFNLG